MRRALALLPVVLLLAGCAPVVSMTPAPQATSARCAGVIVRLPEALGDQAARATDAQATAAWGLPASVTLTCGVANPALSTATCLTIGGVDWLVDQEEIDGATRSVATTYGRDPATQVVVDAAAIGADTALEAVSEPIRTATRATGQRCLASGS
jgi:uncharacterized protein YceK